MCQIQKKPIETIQNDREAWRVKIVLNPSVVVLKSYPTKPEVIEKSPTKMTKYPLECKVYAHTAVAGEFDFLVKALLKISKFLVVENEIPEFCSRQRLTAIGSDLVIFTSNFLRLRSLGPLAGNFENFFCCVVIPTHVEHDSWKTVTHVLYSKVFS